MPDEREPEQERRMVFPWHPGQAAADEPEQESPAPGYPRQLRWYGAHEPTPDNSEES